jgi:glutathione S-transferase
MIRFSALERVLNFARVRVCDLRARWALNEAGRPYRTRLLGQRGRVEPDDRALQPFGQAPILEVDGPLERAR